MATRKRPLPPHIQKRRRRYYAVLEIPKSLRPRFGGKPRFVQSLETDSLSRAQQRVGPIVAGWRAEIARARGEPADNAAFWRRVLRKATTEEQRKLILEEISDEAWDIGAIDVPEIGMQPSSSPAARDFWARATGAIVGFADHVDEWLAQSSATEKTKAMQRSDVLRFAQAFPAVSDVAKKEVQRWAAGLGVTPKTVRRILSALRGYWRYLQSIEAAPDDMAPFDRLELPRGARKGNGDKRKAFAPADVVKLLNAAADDPRLADLIKIAMWTGCRIEEICSLKLADVHDEYFSIADAKTEAGVREIPIHRELKQTIARLVEESDEYLLPGLPANKYGLRSDAIGKRFGRLKTAKGYGPEYVFHSIRKTVATQLENADVAENVAAAILGHEFPTMTFGTYSGGPSLTTKAKAITKLRYPKQ